MLPSNAILQVLKSLFATISLIVYACFSIAQPVLPQRSLTVTATQSIHFGTFCAPGGTGGTVTVGFDGSRTSSGEIILLSAAPTAQPAIFEIKLCQGRNVVITYSSTTILSSGSGGFLILDIGPTELGVNGSRFPTNNDCNFITPLRIGGTLHVPGNPPPGNYSGSFNITFNQE